VLNGSKTFITNGINSDLVIVVAQTDPDKGAGLFAARCRTRDGRLRTRPPSGQIGLDAQDTAELSFTDVKVQSKTCLAKRAEGSFT